MHHKHLRRALEGLLLAVLAATLTVVSVLPTFKQLGIACMPGGAIAAVVIYALFVAIVVIARRKQSDGPVR